MLLSLSSLLLSPLLMFFLSAAPRVSAEQKRPNILHILVDDFGWEQVGYHHDPDAQDVEPVTPNIDELVANGVELDRFYAHKICSPSRTSIQTGRSPIYANVQNVKPESVNPDDEIGGWQGAPLGMTTVAEVLKGQNYSTRFIGKWDVGMATEAHTPYNRGYDNFFGYFHHSNDYWGQTEGKCHLKDVKDLWIHNSTFNGPAVHLANGPNCADKTQNPVNETCVYEEELLVNSVTSVIRSQEESDDPFFLFYSSHLTHMPLQVPEEYLDKFSHVDNEYRRRMRAMSNYFDWEVGEIVSALKSSGLYSNTLIVLHADNGGEIMTSFCGGNNHPLRGGKFSNFEGGIRVNAVVGGGWVPEGRRGSKEERLITTDDWLKTYAGIGGLDTGVMRDEVAVEVGLSDYTGYDQWGVISGSEEGVVRDEVIIGDTSTVEFNGDGKTLVGGIIQPPYKLLLGAANKLHRVGQDVTTPMNYPDGTDRVPEAIMRTCGRKAKNGCLFNIFEDPTEEKNLAEEMPELFESMLERIDELQEEVYSPDRGKKDSRACEVAMGENGGYWG
eukprot:CAMPEP_0118657658 /NCGR_PEP_ID=MMETSP0785-20121206/14138_1 /TAXON_ID=91992 /ORGANISM="Bolidomonas pacifica, Strain CCMP 1866" /LENGTH=555 /DNA_ID=CAMNT_0006550595 /DNA_START=131 /DNA_END=1794 /DNA_ORIENTATION=-